MAVFDVLVLSLPGPIITPEALVLLLVILFALLVAVVLVSTVGVALVVAGILVLLRLSPTPGAVAWCERRGKDVQSPTFEGEFTSILPITVIAPFGYLALAVWVAGESLVDAVFVIPGLTAEFAGLYLASFVLCMLAFQGYHHATDRSTTSRS